MNFKALYLNKTFRNLFSISSSNLIVKLLNLLIVGYPARTLGPENFGIVSFALSIIAYTSIFLFPGMQVWGTKRIAKSLSYSSNVFSVVIFTRGILASICFILVAIFSFYFLNSTSEKYVLIFCAMGLFTNALTLDWIFIGIEKMQYPSLLTIFQTILNIITLFCFIKSSNDLFLYVCIAPTVSFINILIGLYFLKKLGFRFVFPSWKYMYVSIKESSVLGISMSLIIVLHYANNLLVKWFLGPKFLGIFMASFYILELASTIPALLATVFLTRLVKLNLRSKIEALSFSGLYIRIILFFGGFIGVFVYFESNNIVSLLYGVLYNDSIPLLKIMSIGIFFNFLISGFSNILIAFHFDRVLIKIVCFSAIFSVFGGLIFIPLYGVVGASYVISFIDLVGILVSLSYLSKILDTKLINDIYKFLIIFLIIISIAYLAHYLVFNILELCLTYLILGIISSYLLFKNDFFKYSKLIDK